jgi:hypothetical protein
VRVLNYKENKILLVSQIFVLTLLKFSYNQIFSKNNTILQKVNWVSKPINKINNEDFKRKKNERKIVIITILCYFTLLWFKLIYLDWRILFLLKKKEGINVFNFRHYEYFNHFWVAIKWTQGPSIGKKWRFYFLFILVRTTSKSIQFYFCFDFFHVVVLV